MPIKNSNNVSLPQTTLTPSVVAVAYSHYSDNLVTHSLSFDSWSVDGGSSKSSTAITVKQNNSSDYAYVDVPNLTASTLYWGMIFISEKSAGATGSLRIIQSPTSGSNFHNGSGSFIDLAAATTGYPYYFRISTDASTGSFKRLYLTHEASPVNETIKFSDFRIYPTPQRSSAKIAVCGDRAGGFSAQYASDTNRAILSTAADTTNVIALGDHADTTNTFAVCDCLLVTSCTTTSGSTTVTGSAEAFSLVVPTQPVTGTGIQSGATVSSKPSNSRIELSSNASATGTVTLTFQAALQKAIIARGGERYITVGNHDYDGARETEVDDYFSDALQNNNNSNKFYYSKVLGQCEFFFINDNDASSGNAGQELTDNAGGISATQAAFQASTAGQWMVNALANSTARWKIVAIHHACYSSSSTGAGWASNRWAWRTLGAHVVLQSHNHGVERIYKDGLYFITCAMGGGSHHNWTTRLAETVFRLDGSGYATTFGYLKISDSADELVLEYYDTNHNMYDRAKISRV